MAGRELARAREQSLMSSRDRRVRSPIWDSWRRARSWGLHADGYIPPVSLEGGAVEERQETHPLAAVWPTLVDSMRWLTMEPDCLLFASDASGCLLWVRGRHAIKSDAERVHLVPGALWNEKAAGTNGVGTALALRRPFQVCGSEHYLSVATGYTCTAAPIRDPATGDLLGAIDLTCATRDRSPHLVPLIATTARLAESQLRLAWERERARIRGKYADRLARCVGVEAALLDSTGSVVQSTPGGWLPPRVGPLDEGEHVLDNGRWVTVERLSPLGPMMVVAENAATQMLRFQALGRHRALLTVAGVTHELTRRHSEILAVLLANPGGIDGYTLAQQVYGPRGKQATLRAELARLRSVLGHRLASEPYRITGEFTADFLDVEAMLFAATVGEVLDAYPGALLPRSAAPGVESVRARLHQRVDELVRVSGDADARIRWQAGAGSFQ